METTAPEVLTSDHFHFLPPVFTVHWHKWIWFPWRIVPVDIKGLPFSLGLCLAFFPPQSCECSLTLAKSIWVCQATGLGNSPIPECFLGARYFPIFSSLREMLLFSVWQMRELSKWQRMDLEQILAASKTQKSCQKEAAILLRKKMPVSGSLLIPSTSP